MSSLKRLFIDFPLDGLAWLGRQGTVAVAVSLVLGMAMPTTLAGTLKPFLTEAVFIMLCITFLRMDTAALRSCIQKPSLIFAALCWTSLVIPLVMGFTGLALDLPTRSSGLFLGLTLQAIASPIMSAPALAALMGIESTLILVTLVISTALVPLSAPLFAYHFAGNALDIPPLTLAGKLFIILAGAVLIGLSLRKAMGLERIQKHTFHFDGINILLLFIFATAIMENVGRKLFSTPQTLLTITVIGFTVFTLILLTTMLVFLPAGKERALSLGFMSSNRNMGLMLAATGGVLPEVTWLYLAMSQLPIYLSPHLLKLAARYFSARTLDNGLVEPQVKSK